MTANLDTLRTENRRLRARVHHLEVELKHAHERIAYLALAQKFARVRATVPTQGPRPS